MEKYHVYKKKEEIWQSSMTKAPTSIEHSKKQHENTAKNFDNTTIADRVRAVSWSNNRNRTGVVKLVNGIPTFLLTTKGVSFKGTHI